MRISFVFVYCVIMTQTKDFAMVLLHRLMMLVALLAVTQFSLESAHCPVTCDCRFSEIFDSNGASCNTANTTVNFQWYRKRGVPSLLIRCQGLSANYSCEDFANFNISITRVRLEVDSCSPSILRCVNRIYQEPTIITRMESHSMNEYFTKEDLKNFVNVSQVIFYFEDINTSMPIATIESLPAIRELFLIGGKIHLSKHEYSETSLEYIDMGRNGITHIPSGVFKGLTNLKKISMVGNSITYIAEDAFIGLESLEKLSLGSNMVTYLGVDENSNGSLTKSSRLFRNAVSLRVIELGYNQINVIPEHAFYMMKNLERISLTHNNIENLTGNQFANSYQLKEIYLDHNNISNIDLHIFNGTRLSRLNLANNKLQRIVRDTSFDWQTKILDLSNNKLAVFEDWFVDLTDMEHLDLSNNNITMIKESQINFRNARLTIDLRHNDISHILQDIEPKMVVQMDNISLYLSENPLRCKCPEVIILNKWNKSGVLLDFEAILCPDGTPLSQIDTDVYCNETHALIAYIGSSLIGAFVLIITLISLFKHRKKIWQYLLNLRNHKKDTTLSFEMMDRSKLYDVFISFANHDEEFVRNELLSKLEDEYSQAVYLHRVRGKLMPDQVRKSVHKASMTIIILTEHLLAAELSNLEFSMAENLNKQEGKAKVIIILLDETVLSHENLNRDVKSYIDANSYLLWSDSKFWKKLKKKLPKKTNNN